MRPGKVAVILNPTAGRNRAESLWNDVSPKIKSHVGEVTLYETTGKNSGVSLTQTAIREGAATILAAGGDGTIHEVVNGLYGTEVGLAVLPIGTGNDFARTIGIHNLDSALHALIEGTTTMVDVIQWSREGDSFYAINVAGCGFDAEVAYRINSGFRWISGTGAYMEAIVQVLCTYTAKRVTLIHDHGELTVEAMLVAVANAQCYGGGMKIAPLANISDGLLDIVVVQSVSKLEFLRTFPKVFAGGHLNHPRVLNFRTRSIKIEGSPDVLILADGEHIGNCPVTFSIAPKKIKCCVPKNV